MYYLVSLLEGQDWLQDGREEAQLDASEMRSVNEEHTFSIQDFIE